MPPQFDIDQLRRYNYADWAAFGKWCGGRMDGITSKEASVRVMDSLRALFNTNHDAEISSQRRQTGGMGLVFRSLEASALAD